MTRRLGQQEGIALPVAIIVLGLAVMLTGALLTSSTRSSAGSNRDRQVKRALQAADAGLDVARDELNRLRPADAQCLAVNAAANGSAPAGAVYVTLPSPTPMYCPPVTEKLADGTSYSYRLSTGAARTVISTGTAGAGATTTTRRVASSTTSSATITPYFGVYGISSLGSLTFSGGAQLPDTAAGKTQVRSDGTIALDGGARLGCGLYTPGPGKVVDVRNGGETWCGHDPPWLWANPPAEFAPATTPIAFPPVDMGSSKTVNDDARITNCRYDGDGRGVDTGAGDVCKNKRYDSNFGWDPAKRTLALKGYTDLTLRGSTYYFCRLELNSGTNIIVPGNKAVKIYIDSAANCPGVSDAGHLLKGGGSDFLVDSKLPENLQIVVNGGGAVDFLSNDGNTNYLTLYAPDSTITLSGNANVLGAIAGKQVNMDGGGTVASTAAVSQIGGTTAGGYGSSNYRECVTAASDTGGCDTG